MRIPLVFALGLVACGPDVVVPTWTAVDLEALQQRLDAPPGSIESLITSAELIESLASRAEVLAALTESLEELQTMSPPHDASPPSTGIGSGTVAFVEIACPGPDLDVRKTDFSSGWVRIDLPGLRVVQALRGAYAFEGSVLLSFVNCRRGSVVFNGLCPLFVGRDARLAFSARIDISVDDESQLSALSADGVFSAGELSFILSDLNGITVGLTVSDRTELRLSGRDGQLLCRPDQGLCEAD